MAKDSTSEVRIQQLAALAERLLGATAATAAVAASPPVAAPAESRIQADDEVRLHANVALRGVLIGASADPVIDPCSLRPLLDSHVLIASWNDQVTRNEMSLRWGLIHARHRAYGRLLAVFSEIEWLERYVGGGICKAWLTPLRQSLEVTEVLGFDGLQVNPGSSRSGVLTRAQVAALARPGG